MATGSLGSLVVSLAVDTAKFQGDLGRAAAVAERRMRNIRDTATRAFTALAVAATAAGAALTAAVTRSLKNADQLLELSQALGTTVENLSAMTYAASLAGVSQEDLSVAIRKLSSTAVDAASGVKTAAAAFKSLGIEVTKTDGSMKSVDDLVGEIADAFAAAPDSITKTAIATDLFGRSGAKLIPLLNEGAAGIDKMKLRAAELGLVISTSTAKAADQFFDSLTDLKAIGSGFSNMLAAELAPNLANVAKELAGAATGTNSLRSLAESSANVVRFFSSALLVLGFALQAAGKNLGAFGASFDLFFTGNFSQAAQVVKDRIEDSKTEMETLTGLIKGLYSDTVANTEESAEEVGAALAAPVVEAAKQSKAALEEYERYLNQANQIAIDASRLQAPLYDGALDGNLSENSAAIARAMEEIRKEAIELPEAFEDANENAKGLMATLKDESARRSFGAISDAIYNASLNAKDFASEMLNAFRRILSDYATKQIFKLFEGMGSSGSSGGGWLGAIASGIGALFGAGGGSGGGGGGFRGLAARGMTLNPGEWAIAGDAGPEPVFGGKHGATIVPFDRGTKGGGSTLNVTIAPVTNIDARGADVGLVQQLPAILAESNRRAVDEAEVRIVNRLQRRQYRGF